MVVKVEGDWGDRTTPSLDLYTLDSESVAQVRGKLKSRLAGTVSGCN